MVDSVVSTFNIKSYNIFPDCKSPNQRFKERNYSSRRILLIIHKETSRVLQRKVTDKASFLHNLRQNKTIK